MKETKEIPLLFDIIYLLREKLFLFKGIDIESILPKFNFLETMSLPKNFVTTPAVICSQVCLLVSCHVFYSAVFSCPE